MSTVNFVGLERKEQVNFITEGGMYRLRIVKHELDGYTPEGNEKNKYSFEANKITVIDGKPNLGTDLFSVSSSYNTDEKQAWVFMNFIDALKVDVEFEPCDLVGFYVLANVEMRKGQNNDNMYANLSPYGYRWSQSNGENRVPEKKEVVQQSQSYQQPEPIEISDDEVPF